MSHTDPFEKWRAECSVPMFRDIADEATIEMVLPAGVGTLERRTESHRVRSPIAPLDAFRMNDRDGIRAA